MHYQRKRHFRNTFRFLFFVVVITASLVLFGCGGGGSSSSGGGGATNTAPSANAGVDQSVNVNDTVTLDGSGSSDPDGDTLTFSWTLTNVPAGSTAVLSNPTAEMPTFVADVGGNYVAQVIVNDGTDDSAPDTVLITANSPPVANASAVPSPADELSSVTLDGTGSTDDGAIASYTWSQPSGPTVTLNNANTSIASFTAPAVSTQEDLTFRLTVTDGDGASDTDDVTVTVNNAANVDVSIDDSQPDLVNLTSEGTIDWMHWARDDVDNINEKNLANELTTFQVIEITAPTPNFLRLDQRPTEFAWTGGIDETLALTTETGTTTGLFFPTPNLDEQGEGYRLTIPADASEKTLRVYLGLFGARAKFRAFVGAGPDAETEVFLQNDLDLEKFQVVTVNFGAAGPGETLTIEFTLDQDTGTPDQANVSLQAVTLAGATVETPMISPNGGTISNSVQVTLSTATPGASIRYTTDDSPPTSSSTLYTGPFTLSVPDDTVRAMAFLSGFADSGEATANFTTGAAANTKITYVVDDSQPDLVNLTSEGTIDWMHWARDDVDNINEKNLANELTTFQVIEITAPTPNFIRNDTRPTEFAWTGGIDETLALTTETGTTTGLFFPTPNLDEQGEGYRLTIPADASEKIVRVYLGVFGARAKFRAFLGAGPDAETEVFLQNDLDLEKFKVVTVNFGAAGPGETLTIEFTLDQDTGTPDQANVSLQAVTLAN